MVQNSSIYTVYGAVKGVCRRPFWFLVSVLPLARCAILSTFTTLSLPQCPDPEYKDTSGPLLWTLPLRLLVRRSLKSEALGVMANWPGCFRWNRRALHEALCLGRLILSGPYPLEDLGTWEKSHHSEGRLSIAPGFLVGW